MNLTFNKMVKNPGPHDSPLAVVLVGGTGDLLLATGAGLTHAGVQDSPNESFGDEFKGAILYYLIPLMAVDLVVVIARIANYK